MKLLFSVSVLSSAAAFVVNPRSSPTHVALNVATDPVKEDLLFGKKKHSLKGVDS